MKAFELINKLQEIKRITSSLGGYQYFDNINNKQSSEISQLIDEISEDLKTIDFNSSKQK